MGYIRNLARCKENVNIDMSIQTNKIMKVGCVCHKVPYDSIICRIRETNPANINDFLKTYDIGKGCMRCLPFIDAYIKESRVSIIKFKEPQELVISANTQIGVRSITLNIASENSYSVEIDSYGEFADITFTYEKGMFVAYAVPTDLFTIIS